MILKQRNLETEFIFNATRSSGPGGQHVNKVSTRIELRFDISSSKLLSDEEKSILLQKFPRKISRDNILIIVSQSERSQYDNKAKAIEKFFSLVEKALTPVKKRTRTKPTAASRAKRYQDKLITAKKKGLRRAKPLGDID